MLLHINLYICFTPERRDSCFNILSPCALILENIEVSFETTNGSSCESVHGSDKVHCAVIKHKIELLGVVGMEELDGS